MDNKYHILFAGDENYLKYIAVTITSIVKNTDKTKSFFDFNALNYGIHGKESVQVTDSQENREPYGYCFHILADTLSTSSKEKLEELALELSKIYPVEIKNYYLPSSDFYGLKTWRKSYIIYYRLKLASYLIEDIEKILYLDGDIIVNCDLREFFALDLKDNVMAAILEEVQYTRTFKSFTGKEDILNNGNYFNSGVLMINIKEWRKEKIEEKCLTFLNEYEVKAPDQDALNQVVKKRIHLPIFWNMTFAPCWNYLLKKIQHITPSSLEWIEKIGQDKNIKIIHYSAKKPWNSTGLYVCEQGYILSYIPFITYWWHIASQVPIFAEELLAIKDSEKYQKSIRKEERIIKWIQNDNFLLNLLIIFKQINLKFRPYVKKIEAPFKKFRNKMRANS